MPESWIKVHTDLLHDPKILRLHPISRYAWVGLLLLCRTGTPPGTWKATSQESAASDLTLALGLEDPLGNDPEPVVNGDFQRMIDSHMIAVDGSGLVTVTNWSRRQGYCAPSDAPERTRERKRAQRDRERHEASRQKRSRSRREEKDQQQPPLPPQGVPRPDAFEDFWNAYPKDRRRGKFEARQAWTRLRLTSEQIAQVMRSLDAWKLSHDWRKAEGKFIPWPQKFLNKRRWEETPDASSGPDLLAPIDYSSLEKP